MKTEKKAAFTDDFVFGTTLRQNKKICIKLIEMILDIKVKDIEYIGTQESIDISLSGKGVRLDVYVDDGTGNVYDLEMQTKTSSDLPRRSRYYQSMIDQELIESGGRYIDLKRCFVIFICTKDPIGEGRSVYRFEKIDVFDHKCKLDDGTTTVFLNANGRREDIDPELSNFLDYLADNIPTDEFTKEIDEKVQKINKNPEWRRQYMDWTYRIWASKEEGRVEGKAEGKAEGMISLVRKHKLDIKLAAEELQIPVDEFKQMMKNYIAETN